jgi:hypothetical protein
MSCFFSILSFFFYKLRKQESKTISPWGEDGTTGKGKVLRKRGRRVNMVHKTCIHVSKCKKGFLLKLPQESGEGG